MASRHGQCPVGRVELADHLEHVARLLGDPAQLVRRHVRPGLEREGVQTVPPRRTLRLGRPPPPPSSRSARRARVVAAVVGVEGQSGEALNVVRRRGSFEHVDHTAMEVTTGAVRQTAVHDTVVGVVAEAHDAGPDPFEEPIEAIPTILPPDEGVVAHPSEQGDVDLRAEHGRVPQQLPIGGVERVDARLDDRLERRRTSASGSSARHRRSSPTNSGLPAARWTIERTVLGAIARSPRRESIIATTAGGSRWFSAIRVPGKVSSGTDVVTTNKGKSTAMVSSTSMSLAASRRRRD